MQSFPKILILVLVVPIFVAAERSQDIFYKTDGSVVVSIAGTNGKDVEDTLVHGIVYETFQPALSEKTIVAMSTENVVCP